MYSTLPCTRRLPPDILVMGYDTLLKELNAHPGSDRVEPDQYAVESVALADDNLNVACESRISYPLLIAMMNNMSWRMTVISHGVPLYSSIY